MMSRYPNRITLPALVAIVASMFAPGCVSPYQSRGLLGVGYVDAQLERDKWQVSYDGDRSMDRPLVERYRLYRCAELTLEKGYDYFAILESSADMQSRTTVSNETSNTPEMGGTTTSRTRVSSGNPEFTVTRIIKMYPADNK